MFNNQNGAEFYRSFNQQQSPYRSPQLRMQHPSMPNFSPNPYPTQSSPYSPQQLNSSFRNFSSPINRLNLNDSSPRSNFSPYFRTPFSSSPRFRGSSPYSGEQYNRKRQMNIESNNDANPSSDKNPTRNKKFYNNNNIDSYFHPSMLEDPWKDMKPVYLPQRDQ